MTSTSVPGPRHPDTISFSSRSRAPAVGSRSGTRAHDVSTGPTAIKRAVSRQRHQGEDRTRSTRTPRRRKASPSARASWRPSSSRFRWVLQSSILKPGGSPPYPGGALPCRISATCPPSTSAAQPPTESPAARPGVTITTVARTQSATRANRDGMRDSITTPPSGPVRRPRGPCRRRRSFPGCSGDLAQVHHAGPDRGHQRDDKDQQPEERTTRR